MTTESPHAAAPWARATLWALRAGSIVCVLAATLWTPGGSLPPGWTTCLACGEMATAEVIQNIILFVPLGVAFARAPLLLLALAGTSLSLAVELAQHLLPGRDPSVGDLVFNTLGTALGGLLARAVPRALAAPPPHAARFALGAALVAGGVLATTAVLFQPSRRQVAAWTMWTPELLHRPRYQGRVVAASLGPDSLGDGPVPHPARVDSARRAGAALEVTFVAAPTPDSFTPVVALADSAALETLMLGVAGEDVALWQRTRAADWRLDQPDIRLAGVLARVSPGDTITVAAARRPDGYCLSAPAGERCALALSIAQGWALVLYPESLPPWLRRLLGFAWLAALAAPVGLWWRRNAASMAALLLVVAAVIITPQLGGLQAARPGDVAATLLGLGLGRTMSRLAALQRGKGNGERETG